jgi:Na+(H+)/acetate symporter ActP
MAERILVQFEAQADHRQHMEDRALRSNISHASRGQILTAILVACLIGSGTFLLHEGRDAGGLAAILSAAAGPLIAYIAGKTAKGHDLETKRGKPEPRR